MKICCPVGYLVAQRHARHRKPVVRERLFDHDDSARAAALCYRQNLRHFPEQAEHHRVEARLGRIRQQIGLHDFQIGYPFFFRLRVRNVQRLLGNIRRRHAGVALRQLQRQKAQPTARVAHMPRLRNLTADPTSKLGLIRAEACCVAHEAHHIVCPTKHQLSSSPPGMGMQMVFVPSFVCTSQRATGMP